MVCVSGQIPTSARSIGILSGAFNPPTVAHHALITAASRALDGVVCVLPRQYPHKRITGATLDQRIAMLARLGHTVALADNGLFIEIAREFRQDFGAQAEIHFICGRDAADRIVNWDYTAAAAPPIARQLEEYRLLVAQRQGGYAAPPDLVFGVSELEVGGDWSEVSSTQVREWVVARDPRWRGLIPAAIAEEVEAIYLGEGPSLGG